MGSYEYYLAHHGVKGQKWGIRRYQNEDGSLTPEGKARLNHIPYEARTTYRMNNTSLKRMKADDKSLQRKYKKNPNDQKLREKIENNKRNIEKMTNQNEAILQKEYNDKFSLNKAIGYGLVSSGSTSLALSAASAFLSGGTWLAAPIAVAAGSLAIDTGREYLRQISLRKAERGGVT